MSWLQRWPEQLGTIDDNQIRTPAPTELALHLVLATQALNPFAPLESFQLPHHLSGTDGINRTPVFCFLSARNDLEAVEAYLARYATR